MSLDKAGFLQDELNIPILYHYPRNQANKFIDFDIKSLNKNKLKYSRCIPTRDKLDPIDLTKIKIGGLLMTPSSLTK